MEEVSRQRPPGSHRISWINSSFSHLEDKVHFKPATLQFCILIKGGAKKKCTWGCFGRDQLRGWEFLWVLLAVSINKECFGDWYFKFYFGKSCCELVGRGHPPWRSWSFLYLLVLAFHLCSSLDSILACWTGDIIAIYIEQSTVSVLATILALLRSFWVSG